MAAKKIRISSHARFEMRRRSLRSADVVAVVRNPQQIVPSRKGRRLYQSKIGPALRFLLRVVVKETQDAYHIITAYKTTRIAKYWRSP